MKPVHRLTHKRIPDPSIVSALKQIDKRLEVGWYAIMVAPGQWIERWEVTLKNPYNGRVERVVVQDPLEPNTRFGPYRPLDERIVRDIRETYRRHDHVYKAMRQKEERIRQSADRELENEAEAIAEYGYRQLKGFPMIQSGWGS